MSHFRWECADLLLARHLQPKASNDAFAGRHGERVKIRLTASPVDGKANAHWLGLLPSAFAVSKSQVSLENGQQSQQKRVRSKQPQQFSGELTLTV